MPRAVEEFVATGRELRLMSSGTYEMSNYSYPLRQIPDPVRRAFPPSARTSLRRAGGPQSTPVGAVRPMGRPGTDAGVAVFEF